MYFGADLNYLIYLKYVVTWDGNNLFVRKKRWPFIFLETGKCSISTFQFKNYIDY